MRQHGFSRLNGRPPWGRKSVLAGNPPIILAHEPTAALDSHSGQTLMEILTALARERGRAVVVVTHDNRVLRYADRTVHIADGRIAERASTQEMVA